MSDTTLFKPRTAPIRRPLDNSQKSGRIVNQVRMPEMGGMTMSAAPRNQMTLSKPGDTK